MRTAAPLLTVGLLALLGMTSVPTDAFAGDSHYALITIQNPTSRPIHYEFRWGQDAAWTRITVPAYDSWRHWYEYKFPNQNSSPPPYIRFDAGGGAGISREYHLRAHAAPNTHERWGKKYSFTVVQTFTGQLLLDLRER